MDIYREDVMDHYEHPRNQGELTGEGVETARDSNASCGDMVQFFIKVKTGKISEVKWEGIGCAITTAAASKLSEYLQDKSLKDIQKMSEEELARKGVGFEVNPGRMKCLMLPVKVAKKLLEN
ncbi:MAG: iron-sulfur cluster assembly scaffold protein [bacterium]